MTFGKALEEVIEGKRMTRASWKNKGKFIFLALDFQFHTPADLSEFEDKDGDVSSVEVVRAIVIKEGDTFEIGWHPTQKDMLAFDWQEVSE